MLPPAKARAAVIRATIVNNAILFLIIVILPPSGYGTILPIRYDSVKMLFKKLLCYYNNKDMRNNAAAGITLVSSS